VTSHLSLGVVGLLVFLTVLLTHSQFPIAHVLGDNIWNVPTAFSLLHRGNLDLVEYQGLIDRYPGLRYTVRMIDNTPYNTYPLGASLVALPFVAAFDWIASRILSVDLYELSQQQILARLDVFIGSALVAATAVVLYRTARLFTGNASAVLVAFVFAFGTAALSTGSRELNQHSTTMLALAVTLYCLLRAPESARYLLLAGFALAFAFVIRPTNGLSALVLTVYVALHYRRGFGWFAVGAAVVALPFMVWSASLFGSLLPPQYAGGIFSRFGTATLVEGLLGHLVSPNRGLFIFSPVLLFSLLGIGVKWRAKSLTALDGGLLLILLLHWIVISMFDDWYAGHSFGPRYPMDMLPYLCYFLTPFFTALPRFRPALAVPTALALVAATGFSLFVNVRGATVDATQAWNTTPNNVDAHTERAWDWNDLQFMRGMGLPLAVATMSPVSRFRFEFDATSMLYQGSGWASPERTGDGMSFQWTVAREATLMLRLHDDEDLAVDMRIPAAAPDVLAGVELAVNGQSIGLMVAGEVYSGVIPASALPANGGVSELRFSVPRLVVPAEVDPQSSDRRTLGLMLDYLVIRPVPGT